MSVGPELIEAVKAGDLAKVQALLAQEPAAVSFRTENGESAFLIATYYGAREIAEFLLSRGITLNLYEAAAAGDVARVQSLIDGDPTLVNSFAPDGFTPLGLGAFFGHAEMVAHLLARGADPNIPSRNRFAVPPLASAAARSSVPIARMLLDAGADVNCRQESGFTPLHSAADNGNGELAALLLDRGAEVNPRSSDGTTPVGMALKKGRNEVAALLRIRGGVE